MFMGGILWILCCSSNSLAHFIHIHKLPALVGARIPVGEWDILPETPSDPPHISIEKNHGILEIFSEANPLDAPRSMAKARPDI
jgi:hypothetical protein